MRMLKIMKKRFVVIISSYTTAVLVILRVYTIHISKLNGYEIKQI